MVTVIIPCWRRFKNLERILQSWLDQEKVTQVIVWDNSGSFKTSLPVLVFNSNKNLGPTAKLALYQFAKNDIILYADDDVLPKKGFIEDLLKHWDEKKITGIIGRTFTGDSYYNSTGHRGWNIKEPVEVDYLCGLIMLVSAKYCNVDIRKCPGDKRDWMEDWWFERELKAKHGVSTWVAPTNNCLLLSESGDRHAMHKTTGVRETREKFYKIWVKKEKDAQA